MAQQCQPKLQCIAGLHSQWLTLSGWHTAQALAVSSQEQKQHGKASHCARIAVVGLAAGFAAAATAGIESNCEASTYAIEPEPQKSWWSRLYHTADPRHLWQQPHEQNLFLEEMQDDPKVTQHCRSTAEAMFAYLRCMHALSTAVLLTHSSYECDASMHMAYATVYVRCMYVCMQASLYM